MKERFSLHRLALLLVMLLGSLGSATFSAAQSSLSSERLTVPNGTLYEIIAQHIDPQTQFSWVLAKDGTFLQAGRSRSFRTRFTEAGEYRLTGEMVMSNGVRLQRMFVLDVKDDAVSPVAEGGMSTVPSANAEGVIDIPNGSRSVVFVPETAAVSRLVADIDVSQDSNGDGIPGNDDDTSGTYFNTDAQPLTIWLTKEAPSTVRVAGIRSDGSIYEKTFGIGAPAVDVPPTTQQTSSAPLVTGDAGEILVEDGGNGSLVFRLKPEVLPGDTPVLVHWDFGDGSQSMLSAARHRFATDGTYTVSAQVRDLTQATIIATYQRSVNVDVGELPPPTGGDGDGGTPEPEPKPEPSGDSGGSLFGLFLKILLVLVIAIIVGALIAVVLKLVRRAGSLREKLEATDRKMAIGKTDEATTNDGDAVAPLALPDAPEEEKTRREEETPPTPPPTPEPVGPAPSWLQPTQETKTPAPTEPPSPSAPTVGDASVPDWLKAASTSTQAPTQPSEQVPAPQTTEEPSSAPLPSWLTQAPSAPAPESSNEPEPANAKPPQAQESVPPVVESAPVESTPSEPAAPVVEAPAPEVVPAQIEPPPPPAELVSQPQTSEELPAWLSGNPPQSDTTAPPSSGSVEGKTEEAPQAPLVETTTPPPPIQTETVQPTPPMQEVAAVEPDSAPATPSAKPIEQDIPAATAEDEPVAFVRAESIEETKKQDDKQQPST